MTQMDIRARQLARRGEGKNLKAAPTACSKRKRKYAEKEKWRGGKHAVAAVAGARRLFRINLRAKYIFYLNISNGYYFKLPTRWLI